jgi:hypothetical protein
VIPGGLPPWDEIKFRRKRDVALIAGFGVFVVLLYACARDWRTWADIIGPIIAGPILLMAGWKMRGWWNQAGGVTCWRPRRLCFECPTCDVTFTHVERARVTAFANHHLAEVHKIEAPQWGPPTDAE